MFCFIFRIQDPRFIAVGGRQQFLAVDTGGAYDIEVYCVTITSDFNILRGAATAPRLRQQRALLFLYRGRATKLMRRHRWNTCRGGRVQLLESYTVRRCDKIHPNATQLSFAMYATFCTWIQTWKPKPGSMKPVMMSSE